MFIQTYQSLNDIYLLIKSPKRKYNPGISKGTALADTDIFLVDDLRLVNTHLVFNSQVVGHHLETGVGGCCFVVVDLFVVGFFNKILGSVIF